MCKHGFIGACAECDGCGQQPERIERDEAIALAKPRGRLLALDDPKYLKRLAKILTYKADVYVPGRRLYSHDHKFRVVGNSLLHGGSTIDPNQVFDGNGRNILASRDPRRATE